MLSRLRANVWIVLASWFGVVLVVSALAIALRVPPRHRLPPEEVTMTDLLRFRRALGDAEQQLLSSTSYALEYERQSEGGIAYNVGNELVVESLSGVWRQQLEDALSDTDDDGRLELADAWGNPVIVIRHGWDQVLTEGVRTMTVSLDEVLVTPCRMNGSTWRLVSMGADGVPNTEDDLAIAWG